MQKKCIKEELGSNSYPGRGIIIGKSEDGTKAVTAYFIMGRSSNSRNRVAGGPQPDHLCASARTGQ